MPHTKFYLTWAVLVCLVSTHPLVGRADSTETARDAIIQKQMDCVSHNLKNTGIDWQDVCDIPDTSAQEERQKNDAVNQQLNMFENPQGHADGVAQEFPNTLLPLNAQQESPNVPPEMTTNPHPQSHLLGFYFSAGYDTNYTHYSEWSGGKLDEDYGRQNGMLYKLGYQSPGEINLNPVKIHPFIEADLYKSFSDTLNYKGALFSPDEPGITIPYNDTQPSKIDQMDLKIGGKTMPSARWDNFIYYEAGKRTWYRGQDEGFDYREKYFWYYNGIGGGFDYWLFPKFSIGFDGVFEFAYSPKMHADNTQPTFKLGSTWEYQLKFPFKFYLTKNLSFDVTPYYNFISISQSSFVDVNSDGYGLVEPNSKTHQEGLLGAITLYI